ncbi:unnamed protein product [Mesocestoides corti]|uniref:Rho-GAP domain-containing protein n=1 Tax=Mesocestoides corti TaxID=53468 RepID=A0A158QT61_MESCO|nr:unnamed protein product [Mesocestoides corti]
MSAHINNPGRLSDCYDPQVTGAKVTSASPPRPPVPKAPIELSKTAELDPVLALLQSDVSQLDEFRNSLREKSIRSQKTLSICPSTNDRGQKPSLNPNHEVSSTELQASSLEAPACPSTIRQEDVIDAQRDLNSQIHDLIDLEFSSTAKKPGGVKKSATSTTDGCLKELPYKESPQDDGNTSRLRERQHQFRWSERYQRPSTFNLVRSPPSSQSQTLKSTEVKENDIIPLVNGATKPKDMQKYQPSSSARVISMFVPQLKDVIPFWVFSARQLNVLRRMAQTQITLTHERVCPSNRLIRWRIGRTKCTSAPTAAISTSGDYIDATHSPGTILMNQQTDLVSGAPKTLSTNSAVTNETEDSLTPLKSPDSTSHGSTFWPEMGDTNSISSDAVQGNAYGASRTFVGPLFGQSLTFWQRRVGYPFPPCISNMLAYLQQVAHVAHGIFRRAGGKLRVQALRERIEKDIYWNTFDEWQPYDVADLLKQFFRELPECLLTNKLSTTLINIFHHAPQACTIDLLRLAMISLPDENRIALQSLLYFLHALANRSSLTQMSALNLAICLAPSLFRFSSLLSTSSPVAPLLSNLGSRRRRKLDPLGGLDPKDLAEQTAAQQCLCFLITNAPHLFVVTEDIVLKTRVDSESLETPQLSDILCPHGNARTWLKQQVEELLRECGSSIGDANGMSVGGKNTSTKHNWSTLPKEVLRAYSTDSGEGESLAGFEIFVRKPTKTSNQHSEPGAPSLQVPRTWRCTLLFPVADPQLIATKFWNERHAKYLAP